MTVSRDTGESAAKLQEHVRLAAIVVLVIGCFLVLRPCIPALIFAAVVCSATWPVHVRLRSKFRKRPGLAALVMTVLMALVVIVPSVLLAMSLADNVTALVETGKNTLSGGPIPPPDWLRSIPLVGDLVADYWQRLASSRSAWAAQTQALLEPARHYLLGAGKAVGEGVLQLALAVFIGFFFYRDGETLIEYLRGGLAKLAGPLGDELLETIEGTITGVVYGTFGTGLAQALVAFVGFLIAGVPGAFLLGTATFFLSILPIGPPIIWGGATLWLLQQGQLGWALFMFLWGLLAISTIDNLVKPYLISLSSRMPLLLTVLGVFGGVLTFGFIGLFIGPPLLAVGATMVQFWISRSRGQPQDPEKRVSARRKRNEETNGLRRA
jgi:predicted PurR-regulated permease PerM